MHLIELVQPAGALAQLTWAVEQARAVVELTAQQVLAFAQSVDAVAQLTRAVEQARAVVELEQLARVVIAPKCAAFQLNLANRR